MSRSLEPNSSVRVLIVDDEAIPVFVMTSALEEEGFLVQSASDGPEGIEKGRQFDPHLLISDWKLKSATDGIDVGLELRRLNQNLRTIFITGLPERAAEVAKGRGLGVDRFLPKPCDLEELLAAVRITVGK